MYLDCCCFSSNGTYLKIQEEQSFERVLSEKNSRGARMVVYHIWECFRAFVCLLISVCICYQKQNFSICISFNNKYVFTFFNNVLVFQYLHHYHHLSSEHWVLPEWRNVGTKSSLFMFGYRYAGILLLPGNIRGAHVNDFVHRRFSTSTDQLWPAIASNLCKSNTRHLEFEIQM